VGLGRPLANTFPLPAPCPWLAHGAALYIRAPWGREKTLIALGSVVSVAAVISATGNRETDHFVLHE
jgi:hypothetical protein